MLLKTTSWLTAGLVLNCKKHKCQAVAELCGQSWLGDSESNEARGLAVAFWAASWGLKVSLKIADRYPNIRPKAAQDSQPQNLVIQIILA